MVAFLFVSLLAHANPSSDDVECLRSLAEFEYGRDSRFNNMAIAVKFPNTKKGRMFAWDGSRIWLVDKKAKVMNTVPLTSSGEKAVYLDISHKTEIWTSSLYDTTGDGRPQRTFSESELTEIFRLFIQQSFTDFYVHKSMGGQKRMRVMSACQRVNDVKISTSKDESITVAEGVRSLWSKYQTTDNPTTKPSGK